MPRFVSDRSFAVETSDSARTLAHYFTNGGDGTRVVELLRANPTKADLRLIEGEILNLPEGWDWPNGVEIDAVDGDAGALIPPNTETHGEDFKEEVRAAMSALTDWAQSHIVKLTDEVGMLRGALDSAQTRAAEQGAAIERLKLDLLETIKLGAGRVEPPAPVAPPPTTTEVPARTGASGGTAG